MRWQTYWRRMEPSQHPGQVMDALIVANELGTYPCVTLLLRIFATLPVTTATSERPFSALKYIENYLRSTMTQDRLNDLAHMYINRDVELNYDDVIDEFSRVNRRLDFQ